MTGFPCPDGKHYWRGWGPNPECINNPILMALAHDGYLVMVCHNCGFATSIPKGKSRRTQWDPKPSPPVKLERQPGNGRFERRQD